MPTISFLKYLEMILNQPKDSTMTYLRRQSKKRKQIASALKITICFKTADWKAKPAIGGGMMKRQHPQQMICNFITTLPNHNYSSEIEQLEGKILVPKAAAKGQGYSVVC